MAKISVLFGVLLIALGGTIYSLSEAEGAAKMTSLIPAVFGIILLLCGAISMAKPHLNKHVMHLAAMVGLFGVLGGVMRPIMLLVKGQELTMGLPLIGQIGLAGLSALFVGLCVNSFIQARKAREKQAAGS